MLFADASNEFTGQWVLVAIAIVVGVAALLGIFAYFATSREVSQIGEAITALNDTLVRLNEKNEERAADIHKRLNPVENDVAWLKGQSEAFEASFEKFTRIIEANSRANNETIRAFTSSLDTFANVVDRATRNKEQRQ